MTEENRSAGLRSTIITVYLYLCMHSGRGLGKELPVAHTMGIWGGGAGVTPFCWSQISATGAVWRRCCAVKMLLVYPSSLIPVLAASLSQSGANNHNTGVRDGCCPSSRVSWCWTPTASTTPSGFCFSHLQLLTVVLNPHCRLGVGPCSRRNGPSPCSGHAGASKAAAGTSRAGRLGTVTGPWQHPASDGCISRW